MQFGASAFLNPLLSLSEIESFYSVDPSYGIQVPQDRPYTWSNTVTSYDGLIGFSQDGILGGPPIGLKQLEKKEPGGATADFRLYQAGWMYADAVLNSGEGVRAEKSLVHKIHFEDMIKYRQDVLHRKTSSPIYVIITRNGDIPFDTTFIPHYWYKILVVTTTQGADKFRNCAKESSLYKNDKSVDAFIKENNGEIVILDLNSNAVDLKKLVYYLRHTHNVEYLDVTAGGKVIGEMAFYGLLDETRLTMAGQIIGSFNNQGIERPRYLQISKELGTFTPDNSPIMDFLGIRFYGTKHVYFRTKLIYRHLK